MLVPTIRDLRNNAIAVIPEGLFSKTTNLLTLYVAYHLRERIFRAGGLVQISFLGVAKYVSLFESVFR